jgi:hypothetical protein
VICCFAIDESARFVFMKTVIRAKKRQSSPKEFNAQGRYARGLSMSIRDETLKLWEWSEVHFIA